VIVDYAKICCIYKSISRDELGNASVGSNLAILGTLYTLWILYPICTKCSVFRQNRCHVDKTKPDDFSSGLLLRGGGRFYPTGTNDP